MNSVIARLLRRHKPDARKRGAVLRSFARKLGLVYFGAVDQHQDDHAVIRGLTVSTTHRDDHYAVGAFDGYDVSIVDRFDIIVEPDGTSSEHSWVIMQLDLHTDQALPHLFLHPLGHAERAYAKFFKAHATLRSINSLFNGLHSPEFHNRYEVYASSTHAIEIEQLLHENVTKTIAARLWPHAIEIFEGKLFVYTTEQVLNETLLETCLESALWLARVLDNEED